MTNASGVVQTSASFIGNINPIRYRGYYYDTDLGLYYLQSRYYDPETGRFVNGDGYVQTGDGLLDKNMFAYCLDDPVNMADPSGRSCHAMDSGGYGPLCFFANGRCVTHGTVDCCGSGALSSSGIDWNKFKNSDGSYSLYDNRRHSPNNVFHEQLLSVNPSASANLRGGCLGAGISGCIISGAWEWESVRLNLLNFGAYDAYVGRAPKYIGLGAGVSAWSPEITVNIIGWDVTLGADVGAIGAQLGVKSGQFSAGLQYGAGFHFSVGRSNLEMQY